MGTTDGSAITEADTLALVTDVYVYAYPLVTMEYTRRVFTNVAASQVISAPMGQFARMRDYPTAGFRGVTTPNADTLYTIAWFDVLAEPWVISVPDMGDRYFLLPLIDGWTNVFASPGTRTTRGGAQTFVITGPNWQGTLPPDVTEYKSPTALVWLLGRIYCDGSPQDYAAVHALQDSITATPLSSHGRPYTPPPGTVDPSIDVKTAVREQVHALDGAAYFQAFADLLKTNPPSAADAPMLQKLTKLGIVPGQDFDPATLSPLVRGALAKVPQAGQDEVMAWSNEGVAAGDFSLRNGWRYSVCLGQYDANYRLRAHITAIGLGANLSQDAVYPISEGPDTLVNYDGADRYVMHFENGDLPPVRGFWSLTMYGADYFFVPNRLDRYALSARDSLNTNPDGSMDLYIQADNPGPDKESNWLPAPKDRFVLILRLYWPNETSPSLLNGSWTPPAATKVV